MKMALFSRYRYLYLLMIVAGLIVCIGIPPTLAQQGTASPTPRPSVTSAPCLAPSLEVAKNHDFMGDVWITVKNKTAAPAYLTGVTIQWIYGKNALNLWDVSLSPGGRISKNAIKSAAPIILDTSSTNWKGTYSVAGNGSAVLIISFSRTSNAGPSAIDNFSGTLKFSCDSLGTNSVLAVFGTPPPPPSATPITPTVIIPTVIPPTLPPTPLAPIPPTPTVIPPTQPSLTPIPLTPTQGITMTLEPITPSAAP